MYINITLQCYYVVFVGFFFIKILLIFLIVKSLK